MEEHTPYLPLRKQFKTTLSIPKYKQVNLECSEKALLNLHVWKQQSKRKKNDKKTKLLRII